MSVDVDLEEFREKVRAFLDEHAPKRAKRPENGGGDEHEGEPAIDLETARRYQAALYDAGLAGLTMPKPYGQGLSSEYQRVFNEEATGRVLPTGVYTIGLGMVIPTIIEFGTEAQKERYVAKALRGEEIWSQLFSEPGAGSDVAGLQMRAERDGDEWILNGQKVWTTGAHYSAFGAVIARTNFDAPKHKGITMFITDLQGPGVEVRPLRQMTGGSSFNEVFFHDARVPHDAVIGQVDDGWRCAIAMLMNERVAIGAGAGGARTGAGGGIRDLVALAKARGVLDDPVVRQGIVDVYIRQRVLGFISQRTRAAVKAGRAPGPEGSVGKLAGALLQRRQSDLAIALAGPAGVAWPSDDRRGSKWAMHVLQAPAARIAGGTDEVQRTIVGERVLGLPKEPQVDRDIPFREVRVSS